MAAASDIPARQRDHGLKCTPLETKCKQRSPLHRRLAQQEPTAEPIRLAIPRDRISVATQLNDDTHLANQAARRGWALGGRRARRRSAAAQGSAPAAVTQRGASNRWVTTQGKMDGAALRRRRCCRRRRRLQPSACDLPPLCATCRQGSQEGEAERGRQHPVVRA